jgi:hypothetical protein
MRCWWSRTQTIPEVPFLTQFSAAPISLLLTDPVAAANFDLFIQDRMVRTLLCWAFVLRVHVQAQ